MPLDAGFRALLTHRCLWQRVQDRDKFGNESYTPPVQIIAFVTSESSGPGTVDNAHQEARVVYEAEVLTDALGIGLSDKITLPSGAVGYVTSVDTPKDEDGTDLMHTLRVTNTRKG